MADKIVYTEVAPPNEQQSTLIRADHMNSVYGTGATGGHKHDGVNEEGHAGKLDIDHVNNLDDEHNIGGSHKDITINDVKIARTDTEKLLISDISSTEMATGVVVKGAVESVRALAASAAFVASVAGEGTSRMYIGNSGNIIHGDGAGVNDARYRRTGAKAVEFDDNGGGPLLTMHLNASNISHKVMSKYLTYSALHVIPAKVNGLRTDSAVAYATADSNDGAYDYGFLPVLLGETAEIKGFTLYGYTIAATDIVRAQLYKVIAGAYTAIGGPAILTNDGGSNTVTISGLSEVVSIYGLHFDVQIQTTTAGLADARFFDIELNYESSSILASI